MPIYEYECKKCKFVFESYVLTSEERVRCPKCESDEVIKIVSAPNIGGFSSSTNSCGSSKKGFT
jgi:putative FmdB family regulatory protein